jgi:hypothetical protein
LFNRLWLSEPRTLGAVGSDLGITRDWVRQIQEKGEAKLNVIRTGSEQMMLQWIGQKIKLICGPRTDFKDPESRSVVSSFVGGELDEKAEVLLFGYIAEYRFDGSWWINYEVMSDSETSQTGAVLETGVQSPDQRSDQYEGRVPAAWRKEDPLPDSM